MPQPPSRSTESLAAQADAEPATDVAELAARFSAQSGAGLSPELAAVLALEIVLNEIVEQACLATRATGAAIVLRRDGEMVCRASSGSTAPDLGSLLDVSSGLSGECVRTLRTQRCDDVLTDARADVAASFRLGVRSVMVMPLVGSEGLLGVFELFSASPCAFGDRDERTLEALATRAVDSLKRAEHAPLAQVPRDSTDAGALAKRAEHDSASTGIIAESAEGAPTKDEIRTDGENKLARGGFDVVTSVLGVAILACAVLLGIVLGRHLGVQKTNVHPRPAAPSSAAAPAAGAATRAGSSGETGSSGKAALPTVSSKPPVNSAVPPGGLLVFENGKEIFRMPPTPGESGAVSADHEIGMQRAASLALEKKQQEPVVELPPADAENNLLYRVEPQYPDEARAQQIQGAVVLEIHISSEGTVEAVHWVSGPSQLVQAATDAVKQWRFQPRTENGQRVRMHTLVTLNFRSPQ
ncbi:MAG: TonB family protein [Candidatus Sulfotelmatobacter sp.]